MRRWDFYPRSPCGERHPETGAGSPNADISIHALLAESDSSRPTLGKAARLISIHALLAESDTGTTSAKMRRWDFYPRSPCGERQCAHTRTWQSPDFYPRSPCGERRPPHIKMMGAPVISIHALLAESDIISQHSEPNSGNFYPRSPCGERPGTTSAKMRRWDFYPRSPCGERRKALPRDCILCAFLSTLSLRRATGAKSRTPDKY